MKFRELSVSGAYEVTPVQHPDDRGLFLETFRQDVLGEVVGHRFPLAQANTSVSRAGTVRGIHFAELPPSQAKYVTCPHGAAMDVVVDLRVGSPTFARWDTVLLDDTDRRAVYVPEGFGHAFMALAEETVVSYLCSAPYAPGREHAINPLDPQIGVQWPTHDRAGEPIEPLLSPRDHAAPTLAEVQAQGLLATLEQWQQFQAGR